MANFQIIINISETLLIVIQFHCSWSLIVDYIIGMSYLEIFKKKIMIRDIPKFKNGNIEYYLIFLYF